MKKNLEEFINRIIEVFQNNLISVILYGSAVNKENPKDINLLIAVKDAGFESLLKLKKIIQKYKKLKLSPVFLTREELLRSSDVFPIEHIDIISSYKVLSGVDIIKEIKIEKKNLRHQIEFEARSLLVKLRDLLIREDIGSLPFEFFISIAKNISILFRHSNELLKDKIIPPELLNSIQNRKKICRKEKIEFFKSFLETTENLVRIIDKSDK